MQYRERPWEIQTRGVASDGGPEYIGHAAVPFCTTGRGLMNRSILLQITLATLLISAPSPSLPRFASRTGAKCQSCHVDPSGGEMRQAFGVQYGRDDLPVPAWPDAPCPKSVGFLVHLLRPPMASRSSPEVRQMGERRAIDGPQHPWTRTPPREHPGDSSNRADRAG